MRRIPVLILVLASCAKTPSKLDAVSKTAGSPAVGASSSGDPDERLERLERKLAKVAAVLDQALGPADPDPAATYAVAIDDGDPIEGPRDAKVTIVEGYEFLCPYCFMVNPLVEQIRAKYPHDVRVVSKYLVIHGPPGAAAGTYACAAGKQGKFSEMKAALWDHLFKTENGQPRAHPEQLDNIDAIAAPLGLDVAQLKRDAEGCQQWLSSSQRSLASVGVHATPAFFVNGRPLRERSIDAFDKLIREELAKANDSGVPGADYYQREIVAKGLQRVKGRFED